MSNVIDKLDLYTVSCLKLQGALSTNILLFLPGSLSHQHTAGGTICMVHPHASLFFRALHPPCPFVWSFHFCIPLVELCKQGRDDA